MKQAFVSKKGVYAREVPPPNVSHNTILVDVEFSCISSGTEMSTVHNAAKGLLGRVLSEPTKLVPMAINVLRDRGLTALLGVANGATGGNFGKPLGYTASGIVRNIGKDCNGFEIGDKVAIMGVGYANHASVANVPFNLAAPIPGGVSFEDASTVALGCIAMQGVRRLNPTPGEKIIVMGLGIIGMLSLQILHSMGCMVIGIDIKDNRLDLAKKLGCDYTINSKKSGIQSRVSVLTNGKLADGVLFTAATRSSEPMSDCFKVLRRKGRFVLVGVSGMEIKREDIYAKEIDFLMSTSYGPGRYDEEYEVNGKDYPIEYVRWTENRNMQEYLRLIKEGKINVKSMLGGIYDIDEVNLAYDKLGSPETPLLILLKYNSKDRSIIQNKWYTGNGEKIENRKKHLGIINYALVGAGNFARSMHLPNLNSMKDKYHLTAVMSRTGSNAAFLANLYGAEYSTTDYSDILEDNNIDLVVICTRHDLHADYAIKALNAGKAIFVEKPAAINLSELNELMKTIRETGKPYMVGFNRRFSDYAVSIKKALKGRTFPLKILYTMNAGYIPDTSWVHGKTGGGRIVGEGCHIIDMILSIVQSPVVDVSVSALRDKSGYYSPHDNVAVSMVFEDGSSATMIYISNGSVTYPKETMNIWMGQAHILLDNYTELISHDIAIKHIKNRNPSKGQRQEMEQFYTSLKKGDGYPIPIDSIEETTKLTLMIRDNIMQSMIFTLKG